MSQVQPCQHVGSLSPLPKRVTGGPVPASSASIDLSLLRTHPIGGQRWRTPALPMVLVKPPLHSSIPLPPCFSTGRLRPLLRPEQAKRVLVPPSSQTSRRLYQRIRLSCYRRSELAVLSLWFCSWMMPLCPPYFFYTSRVLRHRPSCCPLLLLFRSHSHGISAHHCFLPV